MNLDRIIAVRNNKTVYRDGDRCLKVFNEGYSKADVLNEALNQARIEETAASMMFFFMSSIFGSRLIIIFFIL